jgi:aspartate aminotransferase-like enzyme
MAPPGLAFISFSTRAWEAYEAATMPRFYFDMGQARRYAQRNQTPATPAVPVFYGLGVSLQQMVDEGVEGLAERHQEIGDHCRERALDLGLGLFAEEGYRSNSVTAVTLKEGMSTNEVLKRLREEYDIICGSSKDPNTEMIRIGHMGYVTKEELDEVFDALAEIMEG